MSTRGGTKVKVRKRGQASFHSLEIAPEVPRFSPQSEKKGTGIFSFFGNRFAWSSARAHG
jgi:hypothetical protein